MVGFVILSGYYIGVLKGPWAWFSWHPLALLLAFIALAGNATLQKKIGGYHNTKLHGYLLTAALFCALFGWYVIHTNKNLLGKSHITTYHAWLGLAVLVGFMLLFTGGALGFHPDWGLLRGSQVARWGHRWGGRAILAAGWLTCITGFVKMDNNFVHQAAFIVPLILFAREVLL
eukprot:GGOE01023594.1.p1 GENE.GGOE01023594.1~~GGOE01023594.1.p1  ORF type:complete len:203 (-),score=21.70 GGOE01023594.1:420-941(-)